ncbi:hypothetical protein C8Q80DRAFT_1293315 [Daedaleopsis nitida]|nr:hypothetical protein C8Q80DRAFT_1293315 [Daedaleopsis nitida]
MLCRHNRVTNAGVHRVSTPEAAPPPLPPHFTSNVPIETHPLQSTFRPGDTSELRNKDGRCRNCDRPRKDGEHFKLCKGCKVTLYYSEQCQRAQWPQHNSLCEFQLESEAMLTSLSEALEAPIAGMPNFVEIKSLLRDFTEAHRPSLQGILQAKMRMLGGAETALRGKDQQVCLVPLKYREPGPDTLDSDKKGSRVHEGWEASTAVRERVRAANAFDGNFLDAIPIMYTPQLGPTQMGHQPVYRKISADETPQSAKMELEMYAKFIELGVVLRQLSTMDKAPQPEFMKNVGRKWEWKPLFKRDWGVDPEWSRASSTKERVQLLQRKIAEQSV